VAAHQIDHHPASPGEQQAIDEVTGGLESDAGETAQTGNQHGQQQPVESADQRRIAIGKKAARRIDIKHAVANGNRRQDEAGQEGGPRRGRCAETAVQPADHRRHASRLMPP